MCPNYTGVHVYMPTSTHRTYHGSSSGGLKDTQDTCLKFFFINQCDTSVHPYWKNIKITQVHKLTCWQVFLEGLMAFTEFVSKIWKQYLRVIASDLNRWHQIPAFCVHNIYSYYKQEGPEGPGTLTWDRRFLNSLFHCFKYNRQHLGGLNLNAIV